MGSSRSLTSSTLDASIMSPVLIRPFVYPSMERSSSGYALLTSPEAAIALHVGINTPAEKTPCAACRRKCRRLKSGEYLRSLIDPSFVPRKNAAAGGPAAANPLSGSTRAGGVERWQVPGSELVPQADRELVGEVDEAQERLVGIAAPDAGVD